MRAAIARPESVGRRVPDDRHGRPGAHRGRIAEDVQDVRRHVDRREAEWIRRLLHGDDPQAELADPLERRSRGLRGAGDRLGDGW